MPLLLPQNESSFRLPPAGIHPAICYRLIDLGTQDFPYKGEPKIGHYLLVGWELSIEERMEDARPFMVGRRWKFSAHEKSAMRKDLEAWRGKKFDAGDFGRFDIAKIVGAKCMLTIQHDTKDDQDYANVVGIAPAMKGISFQPQYNASQVLILERGQFDPKVFELLSDGLKDRIRKSPEYMDLQTPRNGAHGRDEENFRRQAAQDQGFDDEIPF